MSILLVASLLQPPAAPKKDPNEFAKWEPAIVAIEKRLAAHPPAAGGVLFVGSSSIVKWDLKASFPEWGYMNVGFGGSVVRDSTHFANRIITPHKPGTIVFYAGDNDIASGRTAEQVATDFSSFCGAIHKDVPKCRILFVAVKPSVARWKQFDIQKRANDLVKAYCGTDDRLTFVDIVPLMLDASGTPDAGLFVKDGLHLSPLGYAKWNAAVKAALDK